MNKGFFWPCEASHVTTKTSRMVHAPSKLQKVGCASCGLYKTCKSPKMPITGKGKRGILVIAEAPGRQEDEQNTQLVGLVGQLFRRELHHVGIDLDKDCWKTNAINCRPPNNRKPTSKEIQACRPRVWKMIEEYKPKLILLLGGSALEFFLGHRWKKALGGITKWRGWRIPDRDVKAWVCPLFHPSYIGRQEDDKAVILQFRQDLKRAVSLIENPFPAFQDEKERVVIHTDITDIVTFLSYMAYHPPKVIAFDYETTGIKPYREGHQIVSCAIADSANCSHAFPFKELSQATLNLLQNILQNKNIKKIAANMKFECIWSRVYLNCRVRGWYWDTMQAAHILDNRPGITGLKFQSYAQFGILDYSSEIAPFMKSGDSRNSNDFNHIEKANLDELLLYNGMDALLTFRLAQLQIKKI